MSSDPPSPLQVTFTPEFKRNLRQADIRQIILDLEAALASDGAPEQQVNGTEPDTSADRPRD